MLLLSKLDEARSFLAEPATRRQPALALGAAQAMLDEVIAFAKLRPAPDPDPNADSVLSRADELALAAQALVKEFNPSGVQSLFGLFGRSAAGDAQRQGAFKVVMRSLPAALEGFFGWSESRFRLPAAGKGWVQVYRVFLDDLSSAIDAF
jgi:hypothetical protein